jgi:hypothetical protein
MAGRGKSIRIDPGPGFASLVGDAELLTRGIILDMGRIKNVNKNPVAERCIEELGLEILKVCPQGGPVSKCTLALATSNMNARIRRDGLSSYEIWTQRDQVTGKQLPIKDHVIIHNQNQSRSKNHLFSAKAKSNGRAMLPNHEFSVGDLIYISSDKDKTKAREKYIIVGMDNEYFHVRKFVKNQFRTKTYDVKKSEVFPVICNTLQRKSGEVCISSSSDDDGLHDEIVPDSHPATQDTDNSSDSDDSSDNSIEHRTPRPQRNRRQPDWMKDYYMYGEEEEF